jgi:hypothetical protein
LQGTACTILFSVAIDLFLRVGQHYVWHVWVSDFLRCVHACMSKVSNLPTIQHIQTNVNSVLHG